MFSVELPARKGRLAIFSYTKDWREGPAKKLGELNAAGKKFGIVVSRFNAFITERLLNGALDALRRTGALDTDITVVRVPGSFELPLAARKLTQGGMDAVICLGCIIRGETSHYEHIAEEVTRGIGQSAQETGVPHAYGVLTCENLEQAIDRAGLKLGNKGFEAALSAVEMASLKKAISRQPSAIRPKPPRRRPAPGRGLVGPTRKRR
ncbi:MAG: 6,7-dimethyl-8-ribityllumazine synthase [Acidobacteriia bacterium]|nr:6,7-dimethyl-8-ribityllumazine synthase [Terriglobia bacterium]